MSLSDRFSAAQTRVRQLPKTPEAADLLELYALFKQATQGDVSGERPGVLDFKGRAKHDAWAGKRGASPDSAMQAYIALVDELTAKYA